MHICSGAVTHHATTSTYSETVPGIGLVTQRETETDDRIDMGVLPLGMHERTSGSIGSPSQQG
jgi:hypothetical protein